MLKLSNITAGVILKLNNFTVSKNGLFIVTASNKWIVESYLDGIFFWYSKPFHSSSSAGFINKDVKLKKDFKELVLIDCDEVDSFEKWMADIEFKIFYTSSLQKVSSLNSIASDIIVLYQNDNYEKIKENYKMCDFC